MDDGNKGERRSKRLQEAANTGSDRRCYKYDYRTISLTKRRKDRYSDGTYRDQEQQRAYIPPFKPSIMTKKVHDKRSIENQRTTCDASKKEEDKKMEVMDETDMDLVNLRRTIYLTISSTVDFEEAGHKLMKIKLEPGQEMHLCTMLLNCCSQTRTYSRYHGLLAERFCMINRIYRANFEVCFVEQYSMVHRLETNELRNIANFFAHLLATDALPWHVLSYIRLTEEETTSSSCIFIKILFEKLSEQLGLGLLIERLNDPDMQDYFQTIFPKDNPKNTRFAINFFACIGLNGITNNLREYYKNMPLPVSQGQKSDSESNSGTGSSSSESETKSESSSHESSDSEKDNDDAPIKRRKMM